MEDYFDYIDDYMIGSLSAERKAQFDRELQKNESLKVAVNNYGDAKKLSEGLLELDMMDTLSHLKAEEHTYAKKDYKEPKSKFRYLIGILILILIAIAAWWWAKQQNHDDRKTQVLASYIKPVNINATKSLDTMGMTSFNKGKYYFSLNRFEEAELWLKLFVSEKNEKKSVSRGYFWLGAAHLEQWELSDAKKAWEKSDEKEAKDNLKLID